MDGPSGRLRVWRLVRLSRLDILGNSAQRILSARDSLSGMETSCFLIKYDLNEDRIRCLRHNLNTRTQRTMAPFINQRVEPKCGPIPASGLKSIASRSQTFGEQESKAPISAVVRLWTRLI